MGASMCKRSCIRSNFARALPKEKLTAKIWPSPRARSARSFRNGSTSTISTKILKHSISAPSKRGRGQIFTHTGIFCACGERSRNDSRAHILSLQEESDQEPQENDHQGQRAPDDQEMHD